MLPETSAEQRSRQEAVVALRRLLNTRVRPRNVEAFASEAQPAFIAAYGRAPQSPEEVQRAFLLSPSYRRWSAANRAAQEMIWVSVGEPIYRDLDRMRAAARALVTAPDRKGSLNLDPDYDPSAEVADVDIHLQPGGYAMDRGEDDVVAGALYECGGNVFSFGQGIGRADSKAGVVIRLLDERFMVIQQAMGMPITRGEAAVAFLKTFVEDMKREGFVADAMQRHGVTGVSVAPAA